MDSLFRLLIIILSILTIPYLTSLIATMSVDKPKDIRQRRTRNILLALFWLMLTASVLSIIISLTAIVLKTNTLFGYHTGDLSRIRTLILTAGNLMVAMHFYKIHAQ